MFDASPVGMAAHSGSDILCWPNILADRITDDGRHIVLADLDMPHHIWLRSWAADSPVAIVLPRDSHLLARSRASLRLDRRLAGERPARDLMPWSPTRFQRQRLDLLLAIIDARQSGAAPTSYDVAQQVVFSGLRIARGTQWKASAERRRTLRLMDQGARLMAGGYRDLLAGQLKG